GSPACGREAGQAEKVRRERNRPGEVPGGCNQRSCNEKAAVSIKRRLRQIGKESCRFSSSAPDPRGIETKGRRFDRNWCRGSPACGREAAAALIAVRPLPEFREGKRSAFSERDIVGPSPWQGPGTPGWPWPT